MKMNNKVSVTAQYLKRLKGKVEDLKILTEVFAAISSTLDFRELMTIVMEKAKSIMNAEACSILLYNRHTGKLEFEIALCGKVKTSDILKNKITLDIGQGIAGWVAKNKKVLIIRDVKKDKRFYHKADRTTGFVTKSLIAAPLIGRRGLIGVAEIINPKKEDYDKEILQILSKHFAIAIENALYHRESLDRERMNQELEIASTLQKSFLPDSPVMHTGNIFVSAVNIPAKQVGGDLYDFIEPVPGKAGVFIGDVSGKGVSAALYMAKIISDFRYTAHTAESPDIVMNRLNHLLSRAPRGMFLTAAYAIVDVVTGQVDISVAGHPPFLWLSNKEVRVMDVESGPPLGIIPEDYPVNTISLKNRDRLIFLTDGVFDAKNKAGERIGFDNLIKFVKKNRHRRNLTELITNYVRTFSLCSDMTDDLTVIELTFSTVRK
jgi:sigma-B regulation protein RsbU (phosphoserine phosphatase)